MSSVYTQSAQRNLNAPIPLKGRCRVAISDVFPVIEKNWVSRPCFHLRREISALSAKFDDFIVQFRMPAQYTAGWVNQLL